MKESKLIEMQRKIEILGTATQNALKRTEALQEFTQGLLASFQLYIGKDEWEKLVEKLKDLNKKENVE